MSHDKYPVFRDPDGYMKMRHRATLSNTFKVHFERRCLDSCLANLADVETICDVPTGPGRLFPYWQSRGYRVLGYDFSEQMVEASQKFHGELGLEGSVGHADAFKIGDSQAEQPDLIASVRFIYYFNEDKRVELLRSLAAGTRRYVLVQYKTTETLKGHINKTRDLEAGRPERPEHMAKVGCSHYQILKELAQAELVPLRIEPIGEFSDRVYVLAEKKEFSDRAVSTPVPEISIRNTPRLSMPFVLFLILAIVYLLGTGTQTMLVENEAFYALGARSVLEGNYWLPVVYDQIPVGKPPLFFWLIGAISTVFGGVSDMTMQLSSLLAAFGALGAIYLFGRRWINREVGVLAVTILATTYEFWEMSGEANAEMLVAALLTVSWGAAFALIKEAFRWRTWLVCWGALGLASITGGGTSFLIGILPLCLFIWIYRHSENLAWKNLRMFRGMAIAILPLVLWSCIVGRLYGFDAIEPIIFSTASRRFASLFSDLRPWYYYLYEVVLSLLPWSILIPFLLWFWGRQRNRPPRQAFPEWLGFSWCIILVTLAVLSFLPNKQDYYLLPMMPWACLILAKGIWRQFLDSVIAADKHADRYQGRQFWGRVMGLRYGRVYLAVTALLFCSMVLYTSLGTVIREKRKSAKPIAMLVGDAVDANDHLVLYEDDDLRLMFYLDEPFEYYDEEKLGFGKLRRLLTSSDQINVLVAGDNLEDFLKVPEIELFVETTMEYRGDTYFLLTNESDEGFTPLTEVARLD